MARWSCPISGLRASFRAQEAWKEREGDIELTGRVARRRGGGVRARDEEWRTAAGLLIGAAFRRGIGDVYGREGLLDDLRARMGEKKRQRGGRWREFDGGGALTDDGGGGGGSSSRWSSGGGSATRQVGEDS